MKPQATKSTGVIETLNLLNSKPKHGTKTGSLKMQARLSNEVSLLFEGHDTIISVHFNGT